MTFQTPSSNPITLAGAPMGDVLHACAFFNSDVEGYRVLTPFIREGIEAGEKAFHIVSAAGCDHHLGHLRDADIAVDAARERGQSGQEIQWLEKDVRCSIAVRRLELVAHQAVVCQ
ncbi:MEDS domain-containing protein [Salinisphaera orenii]|uniref:MEDS domain-containing protein n=1 Tax=Salinisphaera orenii TaxID=856731 RepID=UPI000F4753FE